MARRRDDGSMPPVPVVVVTVILAAVGVLAIVGGVAAFTESVGVGILLLLVAALLLALAHWIRLGNNTARSITFACMGIAVAYFLFTGFGDGNIVFALVPIAVVWLLAGGDARDWFAAHQKKPPDSGSSPP
ncbi:MAG TPA: hypothetical protein VFL99_17045 [Segeticoccus sp.]|uniref:hypothetical protein n=1 Tax=Segeticoccus sp. TaxID=2706531 RepID=UPI002D7EE211|nr:hypothetical protein [Segeticoccus sp.]HET8602035.1 hypothetical protein [Segeticoccus sp.]